MNLLDEDGVGLMVANSEPPPAPALIPIEMDGLPLNVGTRAQESYDFLARAWTNRPVEGLSYTRGIYVLTFESAPVLLTNGMEAQVSLTQNGSPVTIDGTRRIYNPPLVDRDGVDNSKTWHPEFAIVEAILDSVIAVPG